MPPSPRHLLSLRRPPEHAQQARRLDVEVRCQVAVKLDAIDDATNVGNCYPRWHVVHGLEDAVVCEMLFAQPLRLALQSGHQRLPECDAALPFRLRHQLCDSEMLLGIIVLQARQQL